MQEVARGIGLDNRIGGKFLHAGPGYGGSCFPKDTLALMQAPRRTHGVAAAADRDRWSASTTPARRAMARKVVAALGGERRGKTIAVLGLTFKPNTDDMRDSPAICDHPALQDAGAASGYDPEGCRRTPQK